MRKSERNFAKQFRLLDFPLRRQSLRRCNATQKIAGDDVRRGVSDLQKLSWRLTIRLDARQIIRAAPALYSVMIDHPIAVNVSRWSVTHEDDLRCHETIDIAVR